ncbi:hypothetical protein, partial [Providencia hangzhouensis]|uniref:hypothetical protein n=1 Tax=Providencia hangzhouensis TaxID=3031799 RepID=UPI0039F5EE76
MPSFTTPFEMISMLGPPPNLNTHCFSFFLQTQKSHPMGGFLTNLMSGSSLLSHGETPHYHRRYGVSLLSSAWG